ncbi:two-partner secretion domain-containing protein [Yersinia pseudotuberculosis]|uniref:two-partner secretion domain-containing protein n=1 Tax=Yersinia pseudotuberculosis TaxID=633 RepID=UPI00403827AA
MNSKLYKLIFCRRLGCLIAVGEFTRSYGRAFSSKDGQTGNNQRRAVGILSRLAMMTGLALGIFPLLVLAHPVLPVNGHVVIGQGMLDQQSSTLTVTQQTDKLAINWDSFDIAHGHSVIYAQPGSQSIALNQVQGQSASQIYGRLQANGQVFLLNPRGILFGKEAQVNVGGLVASTKYMSNPEFLSGDYRLIGGESEGNIINQANLRSALGGYIALVGNRIDNQRSGSITTPQGNTVLAVGHSVTLNLDHGNLLGVQIQGETVAALIQNGGLIQADGGVIQLTAKGKDMLMDTVIDNTGILQAKGLSAKNGAIYLDGGGEGVVSQMGTIDVNNQQGRGGRAVVEGKRIYLNKNSNIEAQGSAGGGTVLVGGGWQGKDNQIRNATAVVMDKGSNIDVSASRNGPGGTAVLWSKDYTGFHGNIRARGGPQSGDGGRVETSSQRNLQAFGQVDASAVRGSAGYWLLDPAEVTIVSSGAESGVMTKVGNIPAKFVSSAHIFIPTANITQILNRSINTQLNSGTNVTITTSNNSLTGCQWCNITVQADITKTAGADATLTLQADGNLVVNNNITADAGKLNLNLLAGNTTADSAITLNNSKVLLNGGDFLAKHANDNNTARISLLGGRYDVGNFTLDGNTALASQVGVNISNAANISVAGETVISGVSSNSRGQGWRGIDISNNSILTGVGNMTFSIGSNSNVSWMGSFTNATITSDNNIIFQGTGSSSGGVDFVNSRILSKSGRVLFDINGNIVVKNVYGLRVNNSQISAKDVKFAVNVTGVDGFLLRDSHITATSGDINANANTINKGIWISGKTNLNASGNVNLHGVTTNSAYAGADAIKISGNSSSNNVNITAGGHISLIAVNEGKEIGSTVSVDYANIIAKNGDFNLNITGVKGSPFNNTTITANNISMNGNITANDAVLMTNTFLTAKGDIKTDLTSPTKGLWFRGNGGMTAANNILLVANSTSSGEAVKINASSSNKMNITAGKDISIIAGNSKTATGPNINIENVNIETNNGNFTTNGITSTWLSGVNVSANGADITSNSTGTGGIVLDNTNILTTVGDINTIVTNSSGKGIWIKSNSTLNSNKDITLVGVSAGQNEGVIIQGSSDASRNNISAQGNITLIGKTGNGSGQRSLINLGNVSLTSSGKNIDINGSSVGAGDVYFTNVELNATAGNVSIYAETKTALSTSLNAVLSLGGNNSIKAQNGWLIGKAFNTTQGAGIGFRANSSLSVDGNIILKGETEGVGATRKGIDFYGANTLNIIKGSQLSLLGENKGAQDTSGGNGISYTSPARLTVNNNGSLKMEGRSTSGTGINFPSSNNTLVFNGDGDTLIKGSSVAGTGAAISGVVNNSTGPMTIEGISTEGAGVHLFSAEHRIDRINVTGSSTHAEGLRVSGNAAIVDTTLTGKSINGSGVKIDSLPGSSVVTRSVLDNATLNGSSSSGKGVEITSDINGIHHSSINGTATGTGYGINIGENLNVTGTSEADLLILQGVATTGTGTGIKLNGNNDLSNTSLNSSAVDGIALDITGPLANQGNVILNGTASGSGIGAQVNGSLSDSVVNGTSTNGIGVQINGSLENSRINGISANGSGVKVDGETTLDNATLNGNGSEGKGVDLAANLSGNHGSAVHGDTVNGTGIDVGKDVTLSGGGTDEPLTVSGNASGEKGTGVQLGGNNTLDNTTLSGNATDGTGVDITGPLTNSGNTTLGGKAEKGDGVQLDGAITGGTVNGTSDSGAGIKVDGETTLDNATLNGNSSEGKGVDLAANLSGNHGSAVHGDTVNGTGIDVGKDVTLSGGGTDEPLTVSGNASGEKGTGVQLGGNNTLDNTTLSGNATDGHGVEINSRLINNGNTTINGRTSDDGHGVHINGAISGGEINGHSDNSHGVFLDESALLNDIVIGGGTGSYKLPVFIALPETIGERVTLNGKPIDKTQPEGSKAREGDNLTRGKYTPLPPATDPELPPASTDEEKNTKQTSTLTPSQKREDPDMLIMARNHILSTLEGRDLSSSVVTESEQSAAGVTGIMVCLPLSEASEHEPCDTYILDKGQPHLPMMVKK